MSEKEIQVTKQKVIKIVAATISLIVLIMSMWIIFDCFKKTPDQQKMIVNYTSTSNVDYKVYLKPNKFYDTKYLDKGKKYISNIIDYIDLNLNYSFNLSKLANTTYTYSILAQINSEYELNGATAELWNKKYTLVSNNTLTKSSASNFSINEKLQLDYEKYNQLANKFKEEYGIASETKLSIILNINSSTKINDYDETIKESKLITITMPLDKAVTDVTVTGAEPLNQTVTETIEGQRNVNYVLLIFSIVAIIVSGPICAVSFYKLFKITNVSQYIVEQKKILKSFGDVIAEVTTKPDLYGLKIIEVKEFDDLINIEDELRVPILFYEIPDKDESWFVITTSTQAYRYILKSNTEWQGIYRPVHKKEQ